MFCLHFEVVLILPNLNVVARLVVPAGWGSSLPRPAILASLFNIIVMSVPAS